MRPFFALLIVVAILSASACTDDSASATVHEAAQAVREVQQPASILAQLSAPPKAEAVTPQTIPTSTAVPTPTPYDGPLMANNYSPDVEGFPDSWSRHVSESGGYSLEVPDDWTVSFTDRGEAEVIPPTRQKVDRIYISYLDYQKDADDNLVEWLEEWNAVGREMPHSGEFRAVDFDTSDDTSSEQAYEFVPWAPIGQAYILENGRMLLRLFTYGANDKQDAVLRHVAESVQFASDAPKSLTDIFGTGELANRPTIEELVAEQEYFHIQAVRETALSALEFRLSTGYLPRHILTDNEITDEFIRLMEEHADQVDAADLVRAVSTQQALTATPTVDPTQIAFQATDQVYYQRVYAEKTMTAIAPPVSPLVPTATPTPTPISPEILEDVAAEYPGLEPFIQKSIYGPDYDGKLVWYDPKIWDLQQYGDAGVLKLKENPACSLGLQGGPRGATPFSTQDLAGMEWTIYWYGPNDWGYSGRRDNSTFLFDLSAPTDEIYRETDKGGCQLAAEDVLNTASIVDAERMQ